MQRVIATVLLGSLATLASAQSSIVIPNGLAAVEGNSSNAFPWGRGGTGLLHQAVYDSTNFTNQGINQAILITGLRWRPNTNVALVNSSYPAGCTVSLSTCPVDQGAVTNNVAGNRGTDYQQCFSGPVSWTAQPAQAGPTPFGIVIPLTTPFLYDPANGDLNIECDLPVQAFTGTGPQLDVQTTGSLASRVYISTGYPTGAATVGLNHGVVVQVDYVPANGLFAGFTANQTTGASPLQVQFTSSSFSSAPGGIVAYLWDFDGDNVIDSTAQNPLHTYTTCGTYTVSLTVVDGVNPNDTETKTGFIVVDPISANFTASSNGGFAPTTVNFTDTSTGTVTGWAWDFDGDSVIDSNLQNPSFQYAVPGTYTVSLTVTNACRSSTATRTGLINILAPGTVPAAPELFQFQFNEVRGQEVANTASTNAAPAVGVLNTANWQTDPGRPGFRGNEPGFGSLGYRATAGGWVDTNWATSVTGSFSVAFWLQRDLASTGTNPFGYVFGNGTFRSFVAGAAGTGITFRGSSIGNVDSGFPVITTQGVWQHLALVVDDAAGQARWYQNGVPSATVVNFTPGTFAYTSATEFAVGAIGTTGTSPLATHYSLDDFRFYTRALTAGEVIALSVLEENAAAGATGVGCAGPGGQPVIGTAGGLPTLGNASFAVTLGNAEDQRLAAIAFGFTPAAFGLFDLSAFLGAGCALGTDPAATNFALTVGNAATQPFGLPNTATLAGLHVYGQWIVLGTQGATTQLLDINIR